MTKVVITITLDEDDALVDALVRQIPRHKTLEPRVEEDLGLLAERVLREALRPTGGQLNPGWGRRQ